MVLMGKTETKIIVTPTHKCNFVQVKTQSRACDEDGVYVLKCPVCLKILHTN